MCLRGTGSPERRRREVDMHTTLLSLALATAGTVSLAAQITVVRPLGSVPRRRPLEYRAPQLLSCPATQYPDSLKRRAIGGHVVLEGGVGTLGRGPRGGIVVRGTPPPGAPPAGVTT